MTTVTLEEAQARLAELIEALSPGEELLVTRGGQAVAKLVREAPKPRRPRVPGSAKGKILYMADDFDAPLDDFKEYME
jgi:antitoxin (DNA-binding transcriptional repressor) of toxin-antitoxin stability system